MRGSDQHAIVGLRHDTVLRGLGRSGSGMMEGPSCKRDTGAHCIGKPNLISTQLLAPPAGAAMEARRHCEARYYSGPSGETRPRANQKHHVPM